MSRLTIIILLFISVGFNSCVNEIEFTEQQVASELVVNSLITPDSIIKVNLSLSKFFLDTMPSFIPVKNYEVKLWLNDVYKEKMVYKNGNYVSVYKPKTGNKLKIIVTNPTNGKITTCETFVPLRTNIIRVDTTVKTLTKNILSVEIKKNETVIKADSMGIVRNIQLNFSINFNDSMGYSNFYRTTAILRHYFADGTITNEKIKLKPDDIVFEKSSDATILETNSDKDFNIFSDQLLDGEQYGVKTFCFLKNIEVNPLKVTEYKSLGIKIPVKSEVIFDLQSITKPFFLYLKTIKQNNTDVQYLSEPVQIYSNISGGMGILGGYTHAFYTLSLPVNAVNFFVL